MRLCLLLIIALGLFSCNSFKVVQVEPNTNLNKEGVFYYLPKTVLQVDITVHETRFMKGPFAQYSSKFTGISNVVTENSSEFSVAGVVITPVAVPDTSKLFYAYMQGMKNKEPFLMTLADNGCIVGLNTPHNEIVQNFTSGNVTDNEQNPSAGSESFGYFATENTRVKTDTILEKIILDTITIEKQILQHSIIEKTMEDKAKDAADYIKLISENKMNLIAGYPEVDFNKETFELMLSELDKLMKDYLALFTGKTIEYTYHYRYVIIPDMKDNMEPKFLFSFFKTDGIGNEQDSLFAENMYYFRVKPDGQTAKIQTALASSKKVKNSGLVYNIPEEASISIEKGTGEMVYSTVVPVCQLGVTAHLPSNLRKVRFKAATGTVIQMEK